MRQPAILVLDVAEPWASAFAAWAAAQDLECLRAGREGLPAIEPGRLVLCVLGCEAPGASSGETEAPAERVRLLRKGILGCPLVVLARGLSIDAAVKLMRAGVADVLELPAPAQDVVARAALHCTLAAAGAEQELLGQSPALQRLRREIAAVAPTHSTVLISGETGVGKGLVAREIHRLSGRGTRPFVAVDCSARPDMSLDPEIFGVDAEPARGARAGRLEQAGDGTLLLDTVDELDLLLQRKLLRVLQDLEYERVGGTRTLRFAARIVATTRRDLLQRVQRGLFRADLLFRLNVFELRVPPLRERVADLPILVRAGLDRLGERLGLEAPPVDDALYARIAAYRWPGNVRELWNVLERWVIRHQAGGFVDTDLRRILGDDAPEGGADPVGAPPTSRHGVEQVIRETGGNVARAARRLGIPRSTLRYRLRLYGLGHLIPRD